MLAAPAQKAGSEPISYVDINKIKAEGLQRSQVMDLASWLTDVYAPRLTGSPMSQKAAEWTVAKLKEYGLAQREDRALGEPQRVRARVDERQVLPGRRGDRAIPDPGNADGMDARNRRPRGGEAVLVTATSEADLAAYKGKLKGKWVLMQAAPDVAAYWKPQATRHTAEELAALEAWPAPAPLEFSSLADYWAALIPASFDFVFFETVPERPGIQPQQPRGSLLDPLTPFKRFQQ